MRLRERALSQQASATFWTPLERRMLRAQLRSLAKTPGLTRMRLRSSAMVTSRTWWEQFSMPQWPRIASAKALAERLAGEKYQAVSSRLVHRPVAALRSQVERVTRMPMARYGAQSVPAKVPARSKVWTMRSSCRLRPLSWLLAVSRTGSWPAVSRNRSIKPGWFSFTCASRSLPVFNAASNVFLTVHGVEREQAAGQAELHDERLCRRDLVAFVRHRKMAEDDLVVDGEGAEQMGRLPVGEGVEAAPKGLAVDRHDGRSSLLRLPTQRRRMAAHRPLDRLRVELLQDVADRAVGRRPAQGDGRKGRVQLRQMDCDEAIHPPVRRRSGQHRQDRVQHHRHMRVHLPLATARIGA